MVKLKVYLVEIAYQAQNACHGLGMRRGLGVCSGLGQDGYLARVGSVALGRYFDGFEARVVPSHDRILGSCDCYSKRSANLDISHFRIHNIPSTRNGV
jgi:hypothetical protein